MFPKTMLMNKRAILLMFVLSVFFISDLQAKGTFIRIFNKEGRKIARGNLISTTDTSVIIQQHKKQVEILITSVGFIKTQRTFGHAIALGATIGALAGALIGLAAGGDSGNAQFTEFDSEGTGLASGVIVGATGGIVLGAAISSLQKRKMIVINGSVDEWQQKKQLLNEL